MSAHWSKVLGLYRRLLRLHERLPDPDMAVIGRQFAREEFRRHVSADPVFVASFVKEWTVRTFLFCFSHTRTQKVCRLVCMISDLPSLIF